MAFAAIHPEAGRIDATQVDLGAGLTWEQVHKVRPRLALRCPDCGHGVHAKVSTRKLRYFAHNPGRPTECAWDNESLEHHLLKLELATAIRDLGWHAELEVRAPDGSWRADVLASSHDGARRIAWEAQLSQITDEDIDERTTRYDDAGIEVCWVGIANRLSWIGVVPSLQVRGPDDDVGPWTVVDGVARFDYRKGSWLVITASLPEVLGWVLRGQIDFHRVLPRYKRVLLGDGRGSDRRNWIWTTTRSVDAQHRHEQMRQRQEAWKREQAELQRKAELLQAHEAALVEDAQRAEAERVRRSREAQQAAQLARLERQRALEQEARQKQRAAEEQLRREQQELAEKQRQRQEEVESQAAAAWWQEVSVAQIDELVAAVAGPEWQKTGIRLEFDEHTTPEHAYGVAIFYQKTNRYGSIRQLYGVMRPSPASLHRLPKQVPVFVRNAREAGALIETGAIEPSRVIHFDLPDYEQLSLI